VPIVSSTAARPTALSLVGVSGYLVCVMGLGDARVRGGTRPLKRGDVVEVRSAAEIVATLDGDASTEGIPFMPEMLTHVGRRFTVSHRVEKICDTVSGGPPASRRMLRTVFLDDVRCDGLGHGGCQAGCRVYWKESWLRRVDPSEELTLPPADGLADLERRSRGAARTTPEFDSSERYRCQATRALDASEPLRPYDPRQYARELRYENVGLLRFIRVMARALKFGIGRPLRLVGYKSLPYYGLPPSSVRDVLRLRPESTGLLLFFRTLGSALSTLTLRRFRSHANRAPDEADFSPMTTSLEPGDLVEVRSPEEIARTIDPRGTTKGLAFDPEMLPFCGGQFRVQDRVQRIIDEKTGRMIELSSDCLILENVTCSGERSPGRWLCPRAIYPYWREAWLRRVGSNPSDLPTDSVPS
jgi:hypothetical protein